jgi:hypothetical protein
MITIEDFQVAVSSLLQLLPMQRALDPAALLLAWDTFPERAKIDLTDEILLYAVQQRVLDPEPPKGVAPHVALLRYAYPVDRTIRRERGDEVVSDYPMLERGLRRDLAQRMAAPDRFHDPSPVRYEQAPPQPRLPARSSQWHPDQLTTEQRRAHVRGVAAAVAKLREQGMDSTIWTIAQLSQGRWWFERALQGFWPLEADDGGLAAAWILRNGRWADQLLEGAADGTAQAAPAEAVVASFAGSR